MQLHRLRSRRRGATLFDLQHRLLGQPFKQGIELRLHLARDVLGVPIPKIEDEPLGSREEFGRQPLAHQAHARKVNGLRRWHEVLLTAPLGSLRDPCSLDPMLLGRPANAIEALGQEPVGLNDEGRN
jgi:hypothetical protein